MQRLQRNKNKGRSLLLPPALSRIDPRLVTQSPALLPVSAMQSHVQTILFQVNTELICVKPRGTSRQPFPAGRFC